MIATAVTSVTATKSRTPAVYVPRRFRIGALEGIRQGAAIVGTPQGDGTVAIDVELTPYVEPSPERWSTWAGEAGRRHATDDEDLLIGEEPRTRIVFESDLVEVGRFMQGTVAVTDEVAGAQLSRWIDAGRAAYVADGYVPSQDLADEYVPAN
jgi:hypothetical protein